jgi:hypothetical protein
MATIGKYDLSEWTPELAETVRVTCRPDPETEGLTAVTKWLEEKGTGKQGHHLPPAGLADLSPAVLGLPHPDDHVPHLRHCTGKIREFAGRTA